MAGELGLGGDPGVDDERVDAAAAARDAAGALGEIGARGSLGDVERVAAAARAPSRARSAPVGRRSRPAASSWARARAPWRGARPGSDRRDGSRPPRSSPQRRPRGHHRAHEVAEGGQAAGDHPRVGLHLAHRGLRGVEERGVGLGLRRRAPERGDVGLVPDLVGAHGQLRESGVGAPERAVRPRSASRTRRSTWRTSAGRAAASAAPRFPRGPAGRVVEHGPPAHPVPGQPPATSSAKRQS